MRPVDVGLDSNVLSTARFEMDHYSGEVLAITNEDGEHDERDGKTWADFIVVELHSCKHAGQYTTDV